MMAGSPGSYYRLADLPRLTFSASVDTVDVPQASLDLELKPRLLSRRASISDAVLLCSPGPNCTTMFWCCSVKRDRSVGSFNKT